MKSADNLFDKYRKALAILQSRQSYIKIKFFSHVSFLFFSLQK